MSRAATWAAEPGQRRGRSAGGSRRPRTAIGKGGAAGRPAGGRRLLPALSAEDGSDDSSRRGHFLLGWMRRSRRRRGGDRTEDGPCRGEVSPGLAARPPPMDPPESRRDRHSWGRGCPAGHVPTPLASPRAWGEDRGREGARVSVRRWGPRAAFVPRV